VFRALSTWFDRRRAFRELRSAEYHHGLDFGNIFSNKIDIARQTFNAGDSARALEIWRELNAQFPEMSATSETGLKLALNLGCFDEAEALMQQGRRRHPARAQFFLLGLARVAHRRGNAEDAVRQCTVLLRKFPRAADGYHLAANCLIGLGRHDEADAMLGRGVIRLPGDFNMNVHYAQSAMHRRAWPEALRRWELVRNCFENIAVPIGAAQCLMKMDRLKEAEELLSGARSKFGISDQLLAELAELETAKGNFDEAILCWEDVLRRFPHFAIAYTKGAEAMRRANRETEADELLCAAVTRLKSHLGIHLEYARSAHRRKEWAVAAERWALVRERFPDCAEAREQEANAQAANEREGSSRCVRSENHTDRAHE
jgi:tetratricopeptide (TPR) repeat protein